MLKGHELRAAHIILLAVAINVLAVARMLIMRWVRGVPANADQPEVGRRTA